MQPSSSYCTLFTSPAICKTWTLLSELVFTWWGFVCCFVFVYRIVTCSFLCTFCTIFNNKQVRQWWLSSSTHAEPTSTRHTIFHKRRISSLTFTSAHLYANVYMRIGVARALANSSDFRRLLGEQSSPKMCDSLPWTPTNRHAKYDAASFILGGEIRNRTNTQKTNRNRYINT